MGEWAYSEGISFPGDDFAEMEHFYREGYVRGKSTGWKCLDELYTVRPGELTVVTGTPGSGKSTWMDNLLINLAKQFDWRFGIFSPENLPVAQYECLMIQRYLKKPLWTKSVPRLMPEELKACTKTIRNHFAWILPQESGRTVKAILDMADELCLHWGMQGLLIDPWNELEHARPKDLSMTEYVGKSLSLIREFARSRGIHIWIVAHPAKMDRNRDGKYPVPSLWDIADSAHWRNKPDNGIIIWRDFSEKDQPRVDIHVKKIRFPFVGRRGVTTLFYDVPTTSYSEFPYGD